MKSNHFRSLSVNIKTQFIPQSINLSQGKNMNYGFYIYLTKSTAVKGLNIHFFFQGYTQKFGVKF